MGEDLATVFLGAGGLALWYLAACSVAEKQWADFETILVGPWLLASIFLVAAAVVGF